MEEQSLVWIRLGPALDRFGTRAGGREDRREPIRGCAAVIIRERDKRGSRLTPPHVALG
jgi:hypothetical protein